MCMHMIQEREGEREMGFRKVVNLPARLHPPPWPVGAVPT